MQTGDEYYDDHHVEQFADDCVRLIVRELGPQCSEEHAECENRAPA